MSAAEGADRQPRLPSFRTRLTLALVSVVLLLVGLMLASQVLTSRRLVRRTITTITGAHLDHDQALVGSYFDEAQRELFAAEHWAQAGLLSPADSAGVAKLLMPVCDSTLQISAAYLTDTDGNVLVLRRDRSGWESISMSPETPDGAAYTSWPEPHHTKGRSWTGAPRVSAAAEGLALLALTRPGTVFWSGLLEDAPGGPGMLVAMALEHPSLDDLVLAYEISLWDLDALLDQMHPTPNGYAVLIDESGNLMERNPPPEDADLYKELETPEVLDLKERLVARALSRLGDGGISGISAANGSTLSFSLGSERWWAAAQPLYLRSKVWGSTSSRAVESSTNLYLLALIPESDLFSELRRQRLFLLVTAGLVMVLAPLLGGRVSRSFGAPISDLVNQSQRIQRLELAATGPGRSPEVREIALLTMAHENMRRALDSFSRYVPTALVRQLLERGEAAQIGGRKATLTILMTDIRHFTSLCELLPPEQLAEQLSEYFECLLGVLRDGGATIDKLVGDSVLSFWGAPHEDADQTLHAVQTALKALAELDSLNQRWQMEGRPTIDTKMGMTRGEVTVGNVGASWRMNYTAMGDAVNLSSRLQQLCVSRGARILVNKSVFDAVGSSFDWREHGTVEIRARRASEELYEPLGYSAGS